VAGKNFGELVTLKIWWRNILANCNELSLSCLIKTCHTKFKTTIIKYFIITCGAKMVHTQLRLMDHLDLGDPDSALQDGGSSR